MATKREYRQDLIRAMSSGGAALTTSAGNGGGTTLVSTTAFASSSLLPTDHLDGAWIYVATATAPRQRRVAPGGLSAGTITVDAAFGSQIQTTSEFEWSRLIALINDGTRGAETSADECVNDALRHMVFADEISVAVTTSDEISLITYQNWLDRPERFRGAREPSPVSGRAPIDMGWRFEGGVAAVTWDGERPKLRLRAPFGQAIGSIVVQVNRPAETWIALSGGSWAEATDGFSLSSGATRDLDQAKPPIREVTTCALPFAWRAVMETKSGSTRAVYRQFYLDALAAARASTYWDKTRDDLRPPPSALPAAPTSTETA